MKEIMTHRLITKIDDHNLTIDYSPEEKLVGNIWFEYNNNSNCCLLSYSEATRKFEGYPLTCRQEQLLKEKLYKIMS